MQGSIDVDFDSWRKEFGVEGTNKEIREKIVEGSWSFLVKELESKGVLKASSDQGSASVSVEETSAPNTDTDSTEVSALTVSADEEPHSDDVSEPAGADGSETAPDDDDTTPQISDEEMTARKARAEEAISQRQVEGTERESSEEVSV